ncbi:hypothetical protein [Falsirhodobacter sp. alg1]|uniref:hypothetical protein n=1 Tax=Falsirhodobacter sp. alg1 TaxID=1472418 RepID=UPI0005F0555F|nr:hypothetical protein [Falsirhodobacter sp. alg1]
MKNPIRIFARPLPTTPDLSVNEVHARLRRYHELLHIRRASRDDEAPMGSCSPEDLDAFFDTFEIDFPVEPEDLEIPEIDALRRRASRFVTARLAAVQTIADGLRSEDRGVIKKAIGRGRAADIAAPDRADRRPNRGCRRRAVGELKTLAHGSPGKRQK